METFLEFYKANSKENEVKLAIRTFEKTSLDILRKDMPQIKGDHVEAYLDFLKKNEISHKKDSVSASRLKATQSNFHLDKVLSLVNLKQSLSKTRRVLMSNDNYILDGHHRVLADRVNKNKTDVIRIDLPIKELLKLTYKFDKVQFNEEALT